MFEELKKIPYSEAVIIANSVKNAVRLKSLGILENDLTSLPLQDKAIAKNIASQLINNASSDAYLNELFEIIDRKLAEFLNIEYVPLENRLKKNVKSTMQSEFSINEIISKNLIAGAGAMLVASHTPPFVGKSYSSIASRASKGLVKAMKSVNRSHKVTGARVQPSVEKVKK